jgi:iron complex outermembrane receptor protein
MAIEVGFKSQLFDNRVRLNPAFFYETASNLQLRSNQGGNVILFNAAKSKMYGMDVDFEAVLSEHWSLKGGFEWLPKAEYTSFPNASAAVPSPAATFPSNCRGTPGAVIGGTINVICDLTGYRMIFASKVSANLGIRYAFEAFNGKAELNAADSYSSKSYIDPLGLTFVDPNHQISASASWTSPKDKWNLRIWGTNVTDVKAGFRGFNYIPGDPRRYGIEAGMRF